MASSSRRRDRLSSDGGRLCAYAQGRTPAPILYDESNPVGTGLRPCEPQGTRDWWAEALGQLLAGHS